MSNEDKPGRVSGKIDEVTGAIKKNVGRLIGNEKMEDEGHTEELIGKAHQEVYKAGERAKGAVEEVTGAAKKHVGKLIDNEQMEAEGTVKELKGKARQKVNN